MQTWKMYQHKDSSSKCLIVDCDDSMTSETWRLSYYFDFDEDDKRFFRAIKIPLYFLEASGWEPCPEPESEPSSTTETNGPTEEDELMDRVKFLEEEVEKVKKKISEATIEAIYAYDSCGKMRKVWLNPEFHDGSVSNKESDIPPQTLIGLRNKKN